MGVIEEIRERLSIFTNLYDTLRLVDPVMKKTFLLRNNDALEIEGTCFDIWKKKGFCDNCIAIRASIEKDTCVKIELQDDKVFLVIAAPVKVDGQEYIVEMLKDISRDNNFFKLKKDTTDIMNILDSMNDKIIKDELTNIYNKRYISERLPVDINNSKVKGQPLSLVIADIDYFKYINDEYGHVIGDKVLKDVSHIISSSVGNTTDWVARYGGDEFLIALNNTNAQNAYEEAEKIRHVLEQTLFQYGEVRANISASFGIYEVENQISDFQEAIKYADKNLYIAKKSGRNRAV